MPASGALTLGRMLPVGAAAGGGLGVLAWIVLASGAPGHGRLDDARARITALAFRAGRPVPVLGVFLDAAARPVFALTTGPNAVAEVKLRLDGISRTPRRTAALLSIAGADAQWLAAGESQGGVTLEEVGSSSVVVLTPLGRREVSIVEASAPPQSPGPSPGAPLAPAARPPSQFGAPAVGRPVPP